MRAELRAEQAAEVADEGGAVELIRIWRNQRVAGVPALGVSADLHPTLFPYNSSCDLSGKLGFDTTFVGKVIARLVEVLSAHECYSDGIQEEIECLGLRWK